MKTWIREKKPYPHDVLRGVHDGSKTDAVSLDQGSLNLIPFSDHLHVTQLPPQIVIMRPQFV